ncbi:MAG: DNA-binding protein [Burkholderiaceae bacterium]|jgi:predicted transcriptional regulator|nr:DNA-binding protein [Burkholderiaceae bacterium]
MKTVILGVAPLDEAVSAFSEAWKTGSAENDARISFPSPEILWKTLTAKRWSLLRTLAGAGTVSIRKTARLAGRDVKAVHSDIRALLGAGILKKVDGGITFPYDAVRVEFVLKVA